MRKWNVSAEVTFPFSSQVLSVSYVVSETTLEAAYRKAGADISALTPKGVVDVFSIELFEETEV